MQSVGSYNELPIAKAHAQCQEAFIRLHDRLNSASSDPALVSRVRNELERYQLWAANVGAGHRKYKLSLDYRLEEAGFYRENIIRILHILERHIRRAIQVLEGDSERRRFRQRDENVFGSPSSPISLSDISSDSEESEESTEPHSPLQRSLGDVEALSLLVESIGSAILTLYRMQIRKPAPLDRLKQIPTEELETYQRFDTMHVMDKFGFLDDRAAASLGKMITRRRLLLRYRKKHQKNLRSFTTTIPASGARQASIGVPDLAQDDNSSTAESKAMDDGATERRSQLQSEATKRKDPLAAHNLPLMPQLGFRQRVLSLPEASFEYAESTTSDNASSFTKESPVIIPLRPRKKGGGFLESFECRYCCLTVHITDDKTWRKHILEDLIPYICTFAGCPMSDQPFESRTTWWDHEMQNHRIEFFCNNLSHRAFAGLDDFEKHMQDAHDVSAEETLNLLEIFKRPSTLAEPQCNLCGQNSQQAHFKTHVSRHLQHLALFAVPRGDYLDEDYDEEAGNRPDHVPSSLAIRGDRDLDAQAEATDESSVGVSDGISISSVAAVPDDGSYEDGQRVVDISWDGIKPEFALARAEMAAEQEAVEPSRFVEVQVITNEVFQRHTGFDLAHFEGTPQTNPPSSGLRVFLVYKTTHARDIRAKIASDMHMDPEHVRLWGIVRRQNKTIRPDEPITDLKEMFSDLDKRFNASSNGVLRVWAEVIGPDTVHCHPTRAYSLEDGYILIFLKHFSVETQSLRGVCHIYVTGTMRTKELVPIITDLMGWGEEPPDDEELVIWEEIRPTMIEVLKPKATLKMQELQNGDILCFQRMGKAQADIIRGPGYRPKGVYSGRVEDAASYYRTLLERAPVNSVPAEQRSVNFDLPDEERSVKFISHPANLGTYTTFTLNLRSNTSLGMAAVDVAERFKTDPTRIQLWTIHRLYMQPRAPHAPDDKIGPLLGHPLVDPSAMYFYFKA